ncbi:GH116 family glycosyl-hydrolase [Rubellicoccus peritrichatus]|uniref:GH116 family glycosyl-hydrolase n=1 Tax=Rubellicoccus peritrichatus TaxID=3080537 RepID=A0AAQ3L9Y6_9BACT|nr:GH116 family glycosyl-hydrolase [Puniceicoccus sp. CR14]WOO42359.1 GH116 family glycosyl-hydrolase [Puniceicoccus sp. CR14]
MERLNLDSGGKTEVVKNFPDSFPEILVERGEPLVYTKDNSENFEYIGMPVGGIGAGQLYLGGDGQLWFWDIFGLNYGIGDLKGDEAYQFPYERSKPNEMGACMIEQGFSIAVKKDVEWVSKKLNREGFENIQFLGQYPIGEVDYQDPEFPVKVKLEAFSPFIPLDLENSLLPATILNYTVKNTSEKEVEAKLTGWLENAVLLGSRGRKGLNVTLKNEVVMIPGIGERLLCSAEARVEQGQPARLKDIPIVTGWNNHRKDSDYWRSSKVDASEFASLIPESKQRPGSLMKYTSKPFVIQRPLVTLDVRGGSHGGATALQVVVNGKVVASAIGPQEPSYQSLELDVSQYQKKEAVIEVINPDYLYGVRLMIRNLKQQDAVYSDADLGLLQDYGTMTLSFLDSQVATRDTETSRLELSSEESLTTELSRSIRLAPGEEKTLTCILTWHFPKTLSMRGKDETRYYSKLFRNAEAVSDYVIQNYPFLASTTRLWRDTWYDSTLPYWFLDRTFLNTSTLASSTSSIIRDGLFYGSEGGNQGPGTCTHVWGYVQAMGRLFPELEISLREQVDFKPHSEGGAMMDDGLIHFRWQDHGPAVDGQSGIILRTYLVHQMSEDDAFLKRNYSQIKKAMQGLTEARDADHDGILTGAQHNTLDADWYGKVTWLSLHYTTALRAMAEMAEEMGDHEYAIFCRRTADKGRAYIEDNLFNGEYFIHEADPENPDSPGTYTGLEYSQLLGQSWAYQVGLGKVIDPDKTLTALESMWRYNFTTDVGPFREVHKGGRWFAMPGESGLIACTWPRGGSEVLNKGLRHFANYNNESQNGYEYAATSLMMWHDMPYHSLVHIWYMHNDRYHGAKRNPWCEIEWGLHYSRSMASYGHFIAASGFEYHGPEGYIAFSPRVTADNFKAAFTTATGWGTFEQLRLKGSQTEKILVNHGALKLKTMAFDVSKGMKVSQVAVTLEGRVVPVEFTQLNERISIELDVTIKAGQALLIQMI